MQKLNTFKVCLLSLMILLGSILNVQAHPDLFSSEATESCKEIEILTSDKWPLHSIIPSFSSYEQHEVSLISITLSDSDSHNLFTTLRLINSYNIALPPPSSC